MANEVKQEGQEQQCDGCISGKWATPEAVPSFLVHFLYQVFSLIA